MGTDWYVGGLDCVMQHGMLCGLFFKALMLGQVGYVMHQGEQTEELYRGEQGRWRACKLRRDLYGSRGNYYHTTRKVFQK